MATKTEKKLSEYVIQRKGILVVQKAVEKFAENFDCDRDACQIPIRLDSLDRIYKEYLEVQGQIELYDKPEMLDTHLQERMDFETRYCTVKGFLLSNRAADLNPTMLNSTMAAPVHASSSFHLRLPKIDLPKFNGDFSRWLAFRDTYTSMIHSNADIPTVAKLQYLLQSLEGEARKPFESVDIEADNYASTWEALLKRYDNKRFLKRQLFRALYDLPPVKRENPPEIQGLADDFHRHVRALAKLGEPVHYWDTPLVNLLSYKLDPTTLRAWEEKTSNNDDVTYDMLIEFLYQRARMLTSVVTDLQYRSQQPVIAEVAGPIPTPKPFKVAYKAATVEPNYSAPSCLACPEKHFLFQCPAFSEVSVRQRRELVSQKRLCWNCFRTGHQARNCTSKFSCRYCHEKHHSLLHESESSKMLSTPVNEESQPIPSTSAHADPSSSAKSNSQVSLSVQAQHSTVLLETVSLFVVGQNGKKIPARALLDSGSMCNFITKKLANSLNLHRTKVDIAVAGIGESTKQIKCQLTAMIESKSTPYSTKLEFLILKRPTVNLPTVPIDISAWNLPKLSLADPRFHIPSDIDMVVGGEAYHELHPGSKRSLGEGLPLLIETVFGWTVSGKISINHPTIPRICHLTTVDRSLEQALQKFWELEAVEPCSVYSVEEKQCEELYATTTTRDSSGRYLVRLPLTRDPLVNLGESRAIAERRFLSLEKRLERDPPTKDAYCKFMDEYERMAHMKKLVDPVDDVNPHCYLPHHPVFKESSTTTKVRVVSDASCKTSSGFSVNDKQLVGPVVQEDLLSIVMRFRTHPIAIVADIEKMYRQIQLHPKDRPLQRILWRSNRDDPLISYELQTVTYGFASAPFLATRTLLQVAQDEGDKYPASVDAVKQDFYVDDFLSGADDVQSAIRLRQEVSAMLTSAGLPLKKWASNSSEVLAQVPQEDLALLPLHDLQDEQSISTLGLVWEPKSDTMRFKVQLPLPAPVLTKRKVMSYIAQIFDPLGLVGPTITVAKLFMQRLWALKTDAGDSYEWDRPLPPRLQGEWKEFHGTLDAISKIRIPRFVSQIKTETIQLHFFSDASEKAYGACCYVRSESAAGIRVQLLTSKSKVAPLATCQSIARLELCAAVLSVSLYEKVMKSLKTSCEVFFWVDSTIVFYWLQSCPSRWKTFVANRVSTVQSSTASCSWQHVPGESNPADLISRGVNPTDIVNHEFWWIGPQWLGVLPHHWPRTVLPAFDLSTMPESKGNVAVTVAEPSFSARLFSRYSSFTKLRRSIAYWMRYFRSLRAAVQKTKPEPFDSLSTADLREADLALCRVAQREMFSKELSKITRREPLPASLKWLKPTMYKDGVIRVGGRLKYAVVSEEMKHPIMLLAKHPLSVLLTEYYHSNLLHAGPQLTLTTLRQKYWVIGGRDLVRRTYHQCHTCFRSKPRLIQQTVADLPSSRVSPTRPFSVCGVDYCGPVYIKSLIRNRAPTKAYIAIFVCFSTRAVHIELVSDLSTPAFLAALRRFVARRGRMREIHSDNGTAFKGASNALNRIHHMLKSDQGGRKQILDWCSENEIMWRFIPPRAPHFGGLWEAAVKSAKHHLLREIGSVNVSYEDMITILAQIEMCLNSRPLTAIPSDPSDLEALTPGHFLVGTSLQAVLEPSLCDVPDNRLSHWQLTQKRVQRIWARWYPEYLQQLQSRATKQYPKVTIEPGRVVVIKDECLPPTQWPLGKIIQVHPNKDGIVRVVTLKTATSDSVVRPVVKLALLPTPETQSTASDPSSDEE
ncbi:uncharacterized protein LOC131680246 [Topomyia yanbarensis]|uniref:uncharacterized protein LOC131680246 n=1 Tax=Topomyia yanbarensis TaxID=2498891 RepID=UPI00273BBE59|nr:uncharacterized protein LOC131680246 [Topomyia yanbarensis]